VPAFLPEFHHRMAHDRDAHFMSEPSGNLFAVYDSRPVLRCCLGSRRAVEPEPVSSTSLPVNSNLFRYHGNMRPVARSGGLRLTVI
jgi:hypothetical protein